MNRFYISQFSVIVFGYFLISFGFRKGEWVYSKQYDCVVVLLVGMIFLARYRYHRLYKRYRQCRDQLEEMQTAKHLDGDSD